uniref:ribonuclease H n=1 Tax=Steinernema glaseri TaxID=37863 RepID=A0A1I8A0F8_9BILA
MLRRRRCSHCGTEVRSAVVYTDGACINNGRNAYAGFGVFWGDDHRNNVSEPFSNGPATKTRAALEAVRHAIKQGVDKDLDCMTIRSDMQYLVNAHTEYVKKWRKNGWKTSRGKLVADGDLHQAIEDLRKNFFVRFEHVPADENGMADQLATQGAEEARGH